MLGCLLFVAMRLTRLLTALVRANGIFFVPCRIFEVVRLALSFGIFSEGALA